MKIYPTNLSGMRKFYLVYRDRDEKIIQSSIGQLRLLQENGIVQSPIGQFSIDHQNFPFKLSWTHYQILMTRTYASQRCKHLGTGIQVVFAG